MKKCVNLYVTLLLFFSFPLFAMPDESTRQELMRLARANLVIGDDAKATLLAEEGVKKYSDKPEMHRLLLRCLAAKGDENRMLSFYGKFRNQFPEEAYKKDLLEEIAWSILKRGKTSSSITIRLASLLGGALTNDIQGMRIILENLQASSCVLRSLAIELTSYYGDYPLKEEIIRLFREENSFEIRLKVIQAVGSLRIESLQPELIALIENEKSTLEEKIQAIIAIANMRQDMERKEIEVLAANRRAGLRMLACEAAAKFRRIEDVDLLIPLVDDERPEVRSKALKAIGLLGVKEFCGKPIAFYLERALKAYDPLVGITAAWVLLLADPKSAEEYLMKWVHHPNHNIAALASSALKVSGPNGVSLAKKILASNEDPFIKMNAAIALISQREQVFDSCAFLFKFVQESRDLWIEDKEINGLFSPLKMSDQEQNPAIPNYPEVMNQTTRLEVLNVLAMMQFPKAHQAIKQFLKERSVGITTLASEVLLGEGDESALLLVRELLTDKDLHIRVQAALVLAVWGHDHTALPTLMENYATADRSTRIKIIEALARIGSDDSIPFLIDRLSEDSQILRILSASALVLTLNH